jgi:hypothetical protein
MNSFFRLLTIEEIPLAGYLLIHINTKVIGFTMIALASWVFTSAQAQTSVTPTETSIGSQKASITTQEARQLAEEAYIFAYSMLENYKTMYAQAVNENLSTFGATFNQFSHRRQLLNPEFTEVVAPNNDTLYSMAWLDLGTEPLVLSLPEFPDKRYYVFQIVDMYAFNVEYIGARTTAYCSNIGTHCDRSSCLSSDRRAA